MALDLVPNGAITRKTSEDAEFYSLMFTYGVKGCAFHVNYVQYLEWRDSNFPERFLNKTFRSLYTHIIVTSLVRWRFSVTACNSGAIQKLSFGVNPTIEMKNVTATLHDTGILVNWNTPLLDSIVVGCSHIFQINRSIKSKWEIFGLCH